MIRPLLLLSLTLPTLTGCAAQSWRFHFDPSPDELQIRPEEGDPVRVRALTTVLRGEIDPEDHRAHILLRLRLENLGSEAVNLTADGMRLVGSDLVDFGPPIIDPEPGDGIREGESRTFEVRFPYPPEMELSAPGLNGLHFSWTLQYPTGAADVSQSFSRRWGYRQDTGPRWSFFMSTGYYDCY